MCAGGCGGTAKIFASGMAGVLVPPVMVLTTGLRTGLVMVNGMRYSVVAGTQLYVSSHDIDELRINGWIA